VPLLVVLRLNFVFFLASAVLFIGKSSLNITGRSSFLQAKLTSSVLLVAGACSSFSEVNLLLSFSCLQQKGKTEPL